DRHVWVYRDNPFGVFAQFNPNVSCDKAPRQAAPITHAGSQTLKLDPQPQPDCALGLVTRKAAPPRSSTKSTAEPLTSSRLTGSTTSFTPSVSATSSSLSAAAASSNL